MRGRILLAVLLIGLLSMVFIPPGCNVVADDIAYIDTLTWTIPGDNGMDGQASVYDIRYSLDGPIDDGNWHLATVISPLNLRGEILYPGISGERDSAYIEIIVPSDSEIHFAVKTGDEVVNWSLTSNSPKGVADDVDPPSQISDLTSLRSQ